MKLRYTFATDTDIGARPPAISDHLQNTIRHILRDFSSYNVMRFHLIPRLTDYSVFYTRFI